MRRRAHHVGRLRIKLAALLIAAMKEQCGLDLVIIPDRIIPAQGRWRTDFRMDVYRWEAFGKIKLAGGNPEGITCTIDSWNTITDCVKHGIELDRQTAMAFEAHAKGV